MTDNGSATDTAAIDADDFLCFAVYTANRAFAAAYKQLLGDLGLTYPQYLVLVALWELDRQSVGAIAARLNLEAPTVTPILKRLEDRGLLQRQRDPDDERSVLVSLTDDGRAMRDAAARVPDRIGEASSLTASEAARLRSDIKSLTAALGAFADGSTKVAG